MRLNVNGFQKTALIHFFLAVYAFTAQCQTAEVLDQQHLSAPALQANAHPQELKSPGLIYKEAMQPLNEVRANLGNWSSSELAALSVGMRKAAAFCAQSSPTQYSGDDLCDLVRVCVLGQSWPQVLESSAQCIKRGPGSRVTHAYASRITALVQTKNLNEAASTTLTLLQSAPYDAEVANTVLYMKTALEQGGSPGRALELSLAEHPFLLAAITRHTALTEANGDAILSQGGLYASAMKLAFEQAYMADPQGASATAVRVDAATNQAGLSAEDAQTVAAVQTAFQLLGKKMPPLDVKQALNTHDAVSMLPSGYGTLTIFEIFPDWCLSCREQMKNLTEFARINAGNGIHAYGLVFHDDFGLTETTATEPDWKDIEGTSTLVVSKGAVEKLGASELPFGVVVDHDGVVRFAGPFPDNAFQGDGYVEKVAMSVLAVSSRRK